MFRRITQTGSQLKISGLTLGISDIANPDFNNSGYEVEGSYGRGNLPQIVFHADEDNVGLIFLSENASSGPDEMLRLKPGSSIQFDYNTYVKAMNIFYSNGLAGDILFVTAR